MTALLKTSAKIRIADQNEKDCFAFAEKINTAEATELKKIRTECIPVPKIAYPGNRSEQETQSEHNFIRQKYLFYNRSRFKRCLIGAITFICLVCACKKEVIPPSEQNYPIAIESVSMQSECLDKVFPNENSINTNEILFDYWKLSDASDYSYYFIKINSTEELNAINPFNCQVDIDFSKYTLIGGCIVIPTSGGFYKVSLEEKENNYELNAYYGLGSMAWRTYQYFWKLYPKLKEEKQIIFNCMEE